MNSKKGKKKSKPNPTPVTAPDIKEIQEEVEDIVDSGEKKNVIETVSDVVLEEVKSEDAGPKKPKRNRGKNKKDIGEDNKNIEGKEVSDILTPENSMVSPNADIKEKDNVDSVHDKCLQKETVTPTIRKKKNKKKEIETTIVKSSPEDQTTLPLQEQKQTPVEEIDTDLQEYENTKKTNKKNKKKKRHDSEKSDKVEEISCTAAFQQFIKSEEEESAITLSEDKIEKEKATTENNKTTSFLQLSDTIDHGVLQNIKESETSKEKVSSSEKSAKDELHHIQNLKGENKNKKKSKKDKKQSKEAHSDGNKHQEQLLPMEDIISEDLTEDSIKDSIANIKMSIPSISGVTLDSETLNKDNELEESPKAKAVIAKPVEKKTRGKQDFDETEKSVEVSDSKNIGENLPQQVDEIEKENITHDSTEDTLQNKGLQENQQIDKDLAETQEFDVIKIPDNAMGKKRKKSPKIPKVTIPVDIQQENLGPAVADQQIPQSNITSPMDSEETIIESSPNTQTEISINNSSTTKGAPEPKSRKKGKKSKIPLTPGVVDFTPTFETDSKSKLQDVQVLAPEKFDQPTPSSSEPNILTEFLVEASVTDNERKNTEEVNLTDIPFIDTDTNLEIDSEISSNILQNIDTQSMITEKLSTDVKGIFLSADSPKSEVTTPTLDIIPDIQYPRSTSQGHDGNNNTVIREARPDELQLPSLKDTPVIQGSGETPTGTPKMFASDIIISEVAETEKSKEKTDLKSKMLEVNRDMEELRLSIERSLAEFTAMEKSEENIEKKYEEKMETNNQKTKMDLVHHSEQSKTKENANKLETPPEYSTLTKEIKLEDLIEKKEDTTLSENLVQDTSSIVKDFKTPQSDKEFPENTSTEKSIETHKEDDISVPKQNLEQQTSDKDQTQQEKCSETNQPTYPSRRENKGKNKKKKGRQEVTQSTQPCSTSQITTEKDNTHKEEKKEEKCDKSEQKTDNTQEKSKQQTNTESAENINKPSENQEFGDSENPVNIDFEPIDNFEDALTSSTEDVDINKSFDMIVTETMESNQQTLAANKPEIKIIGPDEKPKEKITQPKNLLGHPNIPAPSNKTDYKKEKNKTPNTKQAKVKIKDYVYEELPEKSNPIENEETLETDNAINIQTNTINFMSVGLDDKTKNVKENGELTGTVKEDNTQVSENELKLKVESKEELTSINDNKLHKQLEKKKQSTPSQTDTKKRKNIKNKDTFTQLNENEEFVYKYSFRKVFLQNACHVCKKELKVRVPCSYCNLLFYCSNKHKDEDWPQHQALCFAISTVGHLKDQKYIYADTKNITGQNYRLIRMQMILSCEKVLKRRLVPWEQEVFLYPRICADVTCRQWRQSKLRDCEGCGQISYCADKPEHIPKTHQRWCKSYSLYQKLVIHQQTKGRLEPRMPTKVMAHPYQIPDKINEVLASMYEEKIDMNDVQYAALTQLATAPLTAAYGHQVYTSKMNGTTNGITKKAVFTVHVVGAELQFEADALNKWEVFFLHLQPDIQELKVVLISTDLNPSNLPLDLLAKIKHCENCRSNKRRVTLSFQDKKKYAEYRSSAEYCYPDLICAFNPSIQRSSIYKELDIWPSTLNAVLRTKAPFILTAYSMTELLRDSLRMKECLDTEFKVILEAKYNNFASVRPDRNFITDDEMPLIFKNYCYMIVCGC